MEILARAVGRRKEAVAQVQMVRGTGQLIINSKPAHEYLQNDSCAILSVQAPFEVFKKSGVVTSGVTSQVLTQSSSPAQDQEFSGKNHGPVSTVDTIVTVKGGGLKGQADAVRLGIARALCSLNNSLSSLPSGAPANSGDMLSSNKLETITRAVVEQAAQVTEEKLNTTLAGTSETTLRKQLKDKGYLTQDSRVKERRKYGLKKARKATQYHKR
jgi:small subunit ribosomal protein S9